MIDMQAIVANLFSLETERAVRAAAVNGFWLLVALFTAGLECLAIGGLTISNPRLRVIPDLVGSKGTENVQADSHIQRYT